MVAGGDCHTRFRCLFSRVPSTRKSLTLFSAPKSQLPFRKTQLSEMLNPTLPPHHLIHSWYSFGLSRVRHYSALLKGECPTCNSDLSTSQIEEILRYVFASIMRVSYIEISIWPSGNPGTVAVEVSSEHSEAQHSFGSAGAPAHQQNCAVLRSRALTCQDTFYKMIPQE